MIILSILIPTIPERVDMFTRLFNELHRQLEYIQTFHPSLGHIEILVDERKRFLEGGPSIGEKRGDLVRRAEGRYLCFLDDDESISPEYLETLARLCQSNVDVVTFRAMVKLKNFWALVDMRLVYKVNDQISSEYTVRRPPWHSCPVKTLYAKIPEFKHINDAEDFDWMQRVLEMCTTEIHTDKILFSYNHGDHSESDKITQHELQSIERAGTHS